MRFAAGGLRDCCTTNAYRPTPDRGCCGSAHGRFQPHAISHQHRPTFTHRHPYGRGHLNPIANPHNPTYCHAHILSYCYRTSYRGAHRHPAAPANGRTYPAH